jgi:ElaB/YqjD/DUF883 family membrane-anchored ribosome-binding protein
MGEDTRTGRAGVTETKEPAELQQEIEQTRAELGDTVEALAAKTDVKARARKKVQETKATISDTATEVRSKAEDASPDTVSQAGAQVASVARENPIPVAAIGAFFAGVLVGRISKR